MCPLTRKECYQLNSNPRDPAGIRTQDPYIKSVLLYQLSYGIVKLCFATLFVYKNVSADTKGVLPIK